WPRDWSSVVCSSDLLLAPTPLVMQEVGVELRQTYHPEPALLQRAVEHAGVVGREKVHGAVRLGRRAEAERRGDRGRVAFEVAVRSEERRVGKECGS